MYWKVCRATGCIVIYSKQPQFGKYTDFHFKAKLTRECSIKTIYILIAKMQISWVFL